MTTKKAKKTNALRHREYYNLTETFDKLYAQSKNGDKFKNSLEIISSEENILLAYRNIKRNTGSRTAGVDNLTMDDIEKISPNEVISKVRNKLIWYKPKAVRRVEIPKRDGVNTRPLGIPAIWDRLVQQCILQVLEPICEAKFHERSNGFRPNRSAEHAIAQSMKMMQQQNLHFVVDIDIKGFFDNVNHSKLVKQMWTMGIQDKKLICIIKEMLKAPIVLLGGEKIFPTKGTPQGGILSPLLSNIVLNELDWWIASQWENQPTHYEYQISKVRNNGRGNIYRALRRSALKEMYIVRYADDFKIFCRYRSDANKIFIAVQDWLKERLKLDISQEKSKVINLRKNYSYFLGFKLKIENRGKKQIVQSHVSEDAVQKVFQNLKQQIKKIQHPKNKQEEYKFILHYNSIILGVHNYYRLATRVCDDFNNIRRHIESAFYNRLKSRISKKPKGQVLNIHGEVYEHYTQSAQMRYVGTNAILPIGYIRTKDALSKRRQINSYTKEGREYIHKYLSINMSVLYALMRNPVLNRSIEYADNRISLFSAQYGKCAITGLELAFNEIHCHHKSPVNLGGTDAYNNLIIVHEDVHRLIHATETETIDKYLNRLKLNKTMLDKLNRLRKMAGNTTI